jgi:hypothetical protein
MHITVDHAALKLENNNRWWCVSQEVERDTSDGAAERFYWSHFFPDDIFETRAAELDIDPTDWNTLSEVVLYEPWLDPATADPALSLLAAPTVARAREHHLARITATKSKGRLRAAVGKSRVDPAVDRGAWLVESLPGDDPLEVVRAHSPMRPEHIALKRLYVTEQRTWQRERHRNNPAPDPWRRDTVDELRHRLWPTRAMRENT